MAIEAAIRQFPPDVDSNMIAPIRPPSHGQFFQYREVKELPDDRHLRRHVTDSAGQSLMRQAQKGVYGASWARRTLGGN
jgi:hypothetical protein